MLSLSIFFRRRGFKQSNCSRFKCSENKIRVLMNDSPCDGVCLTLSTSVHRKRVSVNLSSFIASFEEATIDDSTVTISVPTLATTLEFFYCFALVRPNHFYNIILPPTQFTCSLQFFNPEFHLYVPCLLLFSHCTPFSLCSNIPHKAHLHPFTHPF